MNNNYLMRGISECPAALVTMHMSIRGFGSVQNKRQQQKKTINVV